MLYRLSMVLFFCLWVGCTHRVHQGAPERAFNFEQDTFQFANQLVWEYYKNPDTGEMEHRRRSPSPTYTHHCFVVARTVHQFFNHADFRPDLPKKDTATYHRLIRKVADANPREIAHSQERIIIPGYANLREFSKDYETAIKKLSGPARQSYMQRGHWRMVMPFSRRHQKSTAENLQKALSKKETAVVHLVKFPKLSINHAILVFNCHEEDNKLIFSAYDPNYPDKMGQLIYDKKAQTFSFPPNEYFAGGNLDAYRIYHAVCY